MPPLPTVRRGGQDTYSKAATRGTEQHEKFSIPGEQIYTVHCGDVAVIFLDPACLYSRHAFCKFPGSRCVPRRSGPT